MGRFGPEFGGGQSKTSDKIFLDTVDIEMVDDLAMSLIVPVWLSLQVIRAKYSYGKV